MGNDNEVLIRLLANSDNFKSGINDASGSLTGFLKTVASGPATWAGFATAAAAAGTALFGLAKMAANSGDELYKLHEQTGMSVENLSLLRFAAEQSDTSIQAIAQSSKFLSKNLEEAAAGNEKASAAFKALGLNVDLILKMSPEDRFLAMAEAISSVEDPGLRSALAIETMGRSAVDLLPMMNQGAAGIKALMDEAERLGLKLTEETGKAANEFNDTLSKLWSVVKGVGIAIGSDLLVPLTKSFDLFVKIAQTVQHGVIFVFDLLRLIIDSLVWSTLELVRTLAELTDALHITSGAAKSVAEWQAAVGETAKESAMKAGQSFTNLIGVWSETAQAQTKLNEGVKANIELTDDQRRAVLGEADAKKEAEKASKAAEAAEKNRLTEVLSSVKDYENELDRVLTHKKTIKRFDDEYFTAYTNKLRMAGYTEIQISEMVTAEKKRLKSEELAVVAVIEDQKQTIIRGVADTIKMLWSDTEITFKDVWKNALNVFVDAMAQMIIQAKITSLAVQLEMAAATSGISLVLGMLAMAFGGSGNHKEDTRVQRALDAFIRSVKESLKQFESEILDTLTRLTKNRAAAQDAFANIISGIEGIYQTILDMRAGLESPIHAAGKINELSLSIANNLDPLKQAIEDRYALEKALIQDVMGLLKDQKAFVKDIDQAITGVARATFTKEELFSAQKGDINALLASMSAATGEEKVGFAGELKQAYLSYFETAKDLFTGEDLAAIQQEVLSGLATVKAGGMSGYDQLIDINLDILNVQREGNDLQTQMNTLLHDIGFALLDGLQSLSDYASGGALESLITLVSNMKILGISVPDDFAAQILYLKQILDAQQQSGGHDAEHPLEQIFDPGDFFASGAYVTKATRAIVGEGNEPEWVLPETKLERFLQIATKSGISGDNSGGGFVGTTQHFHFSFPSIRDFRDITIQEAESLLRGAFRQAAQNLGRNGFSWGMRAAAGTP